MGDTKKLAIYFFMKLITVLPKAPTQVASVPRGKASI